MWLSLLKMARLKGVPLHLQFGGDSQLIQRSFTKSNAFFFRNASFTPTQFLTV